MEDKTEDKIEIKRPSRLVPNMFRVFVIYIFVALLTFFIYITLYEPEVRQIGVPSTTEDSITETTENTITENIISVDFDVEI